MLKKQYRLTSNFQFNTVRKYGKHIAGRNFHLYWLKIKSSKEATKVGFVVSNNFHKTAVVRNRTKRLFREAIRKNFDRIHRSLWIVIYPKTQSLGKSYEEINFDIAEIIQKIPLTE